MKNIYISYANQDFDIAYETKSILEKNGLTVKFVEHTETRLSGDIAEEMLNKIKETNVFLCLFSNHANESNFVTIEINAAVKRLKDIYVINIDHSKIEEKTNFALGNSLLIKGERKRAIKEFIAIMNEGDINE